MLVHISENLHTIPKSLDAETLGHRHKEGKVQFCIFIFDTVYCEEET